MSQVWCFAKMVSRTETQISAEVQYNHDVSDGEHKRRQRWPMLNPLTYSVVLRKTSED